MRPPPAGGLEGLVALAAGSGRPPAPGGQPSGPLSSPSSNPPPGTLLTVWAHPDDETYLSGGLMAVAAAGGWRVVCVTATVGEVGLDTRPNSPQATGGPQAAGGPGHLGHVRAAELAEALAVLGVGEHVVLGYPDGGCAGVDPAAATRRVAEIVEAVRPDVVVTFGPDGFTGHPDHRAVSLWATGAFELASHPGAGLLYPVTTAGRLAAGADADAALGGVYSDGTPPVVADEALALSLHLPADLLAAKVRALRAHRSQTCTVLQILGEERLAAWVSSEEFVSAPVARGELSTPALSVLARRSG